ncbi:MAG: alpha-mannosidase, partial [Chloroflexota bacterium]
MRKLATLLAVLAALGAAGAAHAGSPRVAVFYYPWFSTAAHDGSDAHWNQGDHRPPGDIASSFYPLRGAYSSADLTVLRDHMADIASTGAGVVVPSWWGRGSIEDARLPAVLDAARAHGLRVAVQIEPYEARSPASVADDVRGLAGLGITDFYVYRAQDFPAADWAAALAPLSGVRVLAHTLLVGWAAQARFAGIYTYDVLINSGSNFKRLCTEAHRVGLLCAPSVGPGFDATAATPETRTRPRRDGKTYDAMWQAATTSNADLVTVTSYNEWNEG